MPTPIVRPYIEYQGTKYFRDDKGYYRASRSRGGKLLHRVIWETEYGAIPEGAEIHHRDADPGNNAAANLACVNRSEHTREHLRGIATISLAERREIARQFWATKRGVEIICKDCGNTFLRRSTHGEFCSRRCYKRYHYRHR